MLQSAETALFGTVLSTAKHVIEGKVYIWKNGNSIYRVKAIKSFMIESRCYYDCFFIDIGKFVAISRDDLYDCAGDYQTIAPQAICFKLFGFDELYHCPHIDSSFRAWLTNQQFVGCLMMAEPQYQVQLKHGITMPKITITPFVFCPKFTLYKPILLKRIGASLSRPAFSRDTTTAKVSHISSTGVVYFQLDERSIKYIETQIEQFVSANQQLTQRLGHTEATNCVAIIYDTERNMYHRAKIMAVETGSSTKYKCYYMDIGDTQLVAASNVYALNDSSILCFYPGQAVPATLHMLPTFQDIVFKRLNDILTNNMEVRVKVIDQQPIPTVTIFKRSLNINELIRMELELYK